MEVLSRSMMSKCDLSAQLGFKRQEPTAKLGPSSALKTHPTAGKPDLLGGNESGWWFPQFSAETTQKTCGVNSLPHRKQFGQAIPIFRRPSLSNPGDRRLKDTLLIFAAQRGNPLERNHCRVASALKTRPLKCFFPNCFQTQPSHQSISIERDCGTSICQ